MPNKKYFPYFDPARKENTFPSFVVCLRQNTGKPPLFERNGSEPTIGSDGRTGGKL